MTSSNKKQSLIKTLRLSVSILLLFLALFTLAIKTYIRTKEGNERAQQMRFSYVKEQRQLIKYEVEHVAKLIDYEFDRLFKNAQDVARQRVLEAYSIANHIYETNKEKSTDEDIKQMIIDTLRPIRFSNGNGYYFIAGFDGFTQLHSEIPELEGSNALNIQDSNGKAIFQDMLDIIRLHNEGFSSYYWSKSGDGGNTHEKVSYVKEFKPYGWIIGGGAYLDSVEQSMQNIITHYITTNRFGPNHRGYVFINELLDIQGGTEFARVYANPNRPNDTGKTISDDFKDARGKMFRREFLQGLRDKGECFVDYWYRKIGHSTPSPKTSFFKLAGGGRFIVAAGLYTDDIEAEIQQMLAGLKQRLLRAFLFVSILFLGGYGTFILIFHHLSKKLEKDFLLFVGFFKKAANSSESINRDMLRFEEMDQLAGYANHMLSDKVQIEKELEQEKERLLVTLHSIADGVVTTDTRGNIVLLNKVAEQLSGWSQEKAQGKNIKDILQIQSAVSEDNGNNYASFTEEVKKQDIVLTSRSGKKYRIEINNAPIFNKEKKEIGNVVVFRDETERLKTEEEIFKAQKLESVGLLAGGIAHDFNNLLTGIFGNIELAKLKIPKDDHALPHIKTALNSLQRAKSLTTQLLTFSKGGEPILTIVNLKQILKNVVPFNLSGSAVKVQYKISDALWSIQADPGQISQVISNLVINANHAMPGGGTLVISAKNILACDSELGKDSVELKISDNGAGMDTEVLSKIFDLYFTTKRSGHGLGLSTVYSIIEKHRGVINVESHPGAGTTFSLLLASNQDGQPKEQLHGSSARQEIEKKHKILLIEDDLIVQEVLTALLKTSGYTIDVASEGATGVSMYQEGLQKEQPYQLVISDLTIPGGMGGKEAVQKLLAIDSRAKVIATSGYAMDPIMAQFEKYGFKGRISKPFRLEEVQSEIERVHNC